MARFTEHHKLKKSLFKSIDKIVEQHGLFAVEKEKIGYTLSYWLDPDKVYRVVKGPDEVDEDSDDNEGEFVFNHMPYEVDDYEFEARFNDHYADKNSLDEGSILIFMTEIEDVVWFVCPGFLVDEQSMNSDDAVGFTEYGTLSDMLAKGFIEKVL